MSPVPPLSPASGHSRLNYSSLANLTGVVQMLGPRERQKLARDASRAQAQVQAQAHPPASGQQEGVQAAGSDGREQRTTRGTRTASLATSPETAISGSSAMGTAAASHGGMAGGQPSVSAGSGGTTLDGPTGGGAAGYPRAEGIWAKARGLTAEGFLTWTRGGDG